jgi:hypothetical protein
LHFRSDATPREDQTHFTRHSASQVMSTINDLILDLFALSGYHFITSSRRYFDAHLEEAFDLLA